MPTPTDKILNHSAPEGVDPDCGCVICLAECDRVVAVGAVPTNLSWWRIQRQLANHRLMRPMSRICDVCYSLKNPDGNCSLVSCRNHDVTLECPACAGAREVPRAITSGRDPAKSVCRHPFHGEHLIEEFVAEANPVEPCSAVKAGRRRYEIDPRPDDLGGGWRLRLFEYVSNEAVEMEIGGGVFPVDSDTDSTDAYNDALEVGQEFLGIDDREESEVVASGDAAAEPAAGAAEELTPAEKAKRVAKAMREAGMPISRGYDGFGEPWHVHDGIRPEMFSVTDRCMFAMRNGDIPEEFHGAYLRRIAACVNACMGIPTAVLERNPIPFAGGPGDADDKAGR